MNIMPIIMLIKTQKNMIRLRYFIILLLSTTSWTQTVLSKRSPVTTVYCAKNIVDEREKAACFSEYLNKETRKTIDLGSIIDIDQPYDIKLAVSFSVDTLAMMQVTKIAMLRHPADSSIIKKVQIQVEKVFDRINNKTKMGEGLVAARDKNGNRIAYQSYFPLTLAAVYPSEAFLNELITKLESNFKEKAIYAKREGDSCLLFYESILKKEVSVYQLNVADKQITLKKQYPNLRATLQDYSEMEQDMNSSNYTLCYFFYKDYNYLYKIEKLEKDYQVNHYKYNTESINMIFENLLSIYNSYFQGFLLHK